MPPVAADTVGSDTGFLLSPVTVATVDTVDTVDIVGSDTECSLTPEAKLSLFYKIFPT